MCRADSFESVLSTLCVFDTDLVYPIRKNVLSFVSLPYRREPRGHGLHYRVLLGQAVRLCVFSVITNMQVECVLRLLAASRNSSKELKE